MTTPPILDKTAHYIHSIQPGVAYHFMFNNHRGERAERVVIARSVQWGGTAWHPQLQFFLEGFDLEKQELRAFPLANIELNTFSRWTDEQLDVLLTQRAVTLLEEYKKEHPGNDIIEETT